MADSKNYMNLIFEESMKLFMKSNIKFPPTWNKSKKLVFLDESLNYALKHEYYEQCGVIRDYREQVEKEG